MTTRRTNRRALLASGIAAVALSFAAPTIAQANEPIPVVATFSILGDMVARIGGEHVALTTLVGPDGDAHVYQPTPADARSVSGAEILFVNGLDFEGWIDRLTEASGFAGTRVVATDGITPISFGDDDHEDHHHDHDDHGHGHGHDREKEAAHAHDHGAFDPHAWQSIPNAVIYVNNITAALAKADPENAADFYSNRAEYVAELDALDAEIRSMIAALPEARRTVVTSHDAFGYFADAYGITFLAPQGISTDAEASARDVAALITQIREQSIAAVFVENIADTRLLEQIVSETDATIGGTLFSDALSGPDGPAATYLDMMRHNATLLAGALNS